MSSKNTVIRTMHDIGLAAWFGGALMGAIGLNGAAAAAHDRTERLTLASKGWGKWFPVQLGAVVLHGVGGIGLVIANRGRLSVQHEGRANTAVKTVLTLGALGSSAWSGLLGRRIADAATKNHDGGAGTTEPDEQTSPELGATQKQERIFQWVTPAITAVLIFLAAQQGEQQRGGIARRIFG